MTDLLAPDVEDPRFEDPRFEGADPARPAPRVDRVRTRLAATVDRSLIRLGEVPPESWVTFLTVAACVVFTFCQLHPNLIFTDTTPTGGDMGAHVWGPAYLRDELLPKFRLSGWAPDWYAGFPAYQFYMVIPALLVVLVDLVVPYGMALKMVSVLGILAMPVCCWAFGRLAGLRNPYPAMLALGGTWFLFDESFRIYGGNIASTMAGEFSFSIALSLLMVYLGLLMRGLRTGRGALPTAVVLALAVLCHGIVAIYAVVVTIVCLAVHLSRDGLRFALRALPVGSLLAAFWMLPFIANRHYMSDMGYERRPVGNAQNGLRDSNWQMTFPHGLAADRVIVAFALVGLVVSLNRRRRLGIFLGACALGFSIWSLVWPTALLWNARILPWAYLSRYLLAALGIADAFMLVRHAVVQRRDVDWALWVGLLAVAGAAGSWGVVGEMGRLHSFRWNDLAIAAAVAAPVLVLAVFVVHLDRRVGRLAVPGMGWRLGTVGAAMAVGFVVLGMGLQILPGASSHAESYTKADGTDASRTVYSWGPFSSNRKAVSSGWAKWNYRGYEGRDAYGEYRSIMLTMDDVGQTHGCGRAEWEYSDKQGRYGTPMSMMLLPYWTDGCIGSMEGLFFEASGTTPYHFMTRASVSENSANPHRGLPSSRLDLTEGVRRMQLLGVRYYMAFTDAAIAEADLHPDLVEVAQSGPWRVYLVAGSNLVVPLTNEPVVVGGVDSVEDWRSMAVAWFCRPEAEGVLLADDGPEDWVRTEATPTRSPCPTEKSADVQRLVPRPSAPAQRLPEIEVSNVRVDDDDVWFTVDEPGVPVLVKVSYFPNWEVSGAEGPYRVSPNLMVVVPTGTEVRLHYGRTRVDLAGTGLTVVGLLGLVVLWRLGPVRRRRPELRAELAPLGPRPRLALGPSDLMIDWEDPAESSPPGTDLRRSHPAGSSPPGTDLRPSHPAGFFDWAAVPDNVDADDPASPAPTEAPR